MVCDRVMPADDGEMDAGDAGDLGWIGMAPLTLDDGGACGCVGDGRRRIEGTRTNAAVGVSAAAPSAAVATH